MDRPLTLHDKYTAISDAMGGFGDVPDFVATNLAHMLRPYQTEAIGRYLFYMDKDQTNKALPVQLLFNMATGSGKTLIMAAALLDLFKRGRRDFIFFVNSGNVIEKTRANFTSPENLKYLFSQSIIIDGLPVTVREVSNFSESSPDAINIVFTTIQGLHIDLNNPRENRLTYDELAGHDVVLISDEAHHVNASTKSKRELEIENSWERTVDNIMRANNRNILLEFTATIDLSDAGIWQKYNQRLLYQYDLKAFRQDGYSKDVLVYSVDNDLMDRSMQALIISQYRKKVALAAGVWLKPVVMFKSYTKPDSKAFYETFIATLKASQPEIVERQKVKASGILADAFAYFAANDISAADLLAELQTDFAVERLILIDSDHKAAESQLLLNTLEEHGNEIRAVFSVDMLDEGWDVLNLFDIVRLYDKRDSKNGRPGKTTLREAQLIGRGARYFPFHSIEGDSKFTRKFDANENEPLRVIEQLHYHSAHNPKYIQEIQQALKETGILADNLVERELRLKDSFKSSPTYQKGVVWHNKRLTKAEVYQQTALVGEEVYDLPKLIPVALPSGIGQEIHVFGDTAAPEDPVVHEQTTKELRIGKDISLNVVRAAINRNKKLTFTHLESAFPYLASTEAFMTSKNLLGGIKIEVTGSSESLKNLNQEQKLYIVAEVLRHVEERIALLREEYRGSETFEPVPIREAFADHIKRKYTLGDASDAETGRPQLESSRYGLNIQGLDWYAYSENYGTSEEKSLVKTLDGIMQDLRNKWTDVFLLRNEKAVTLYDFDTGQAFEPDFVLVMNDNKTGNLALQIFIEPKGGQFVGSDGTFATGKEGWKQQLLEALQEKFDATMLVDNPNYRVIGVPFYNEDLTRADVVAALQDL